MRSQNVRHQSHIGAAPHTQEQRPLLKAFYLTANECGKTSVKSRKQAVNTLEQLKVISKTRFCRRNDININFSNYTI